MRQKPPQTGQAAKTQPPKIVYIISEDQFAAIKKRLSLPPALPDEDMLSGAEEVQ
jgi:hypothetical protein